MFYNQYWYKNTCGAVPMIIPAINSVYVCAFIYNLEEATNPIQTIQKNNKIYKRTIGNRYLNQK